MSQKNTSFEAVRRELKGGQEEALLRKLWLAGGGENGGKDAIATILRSEMRIDLVDVSVKLLDVNARAIPPAKFDFEVVDANKAFYNTKPTIDLRGIYDTFRAIIPAEFEIVSFDQFVDDYETIMRQIGDNKQVANAKNGLCLPIIMPKHEFSDYGHVLEGIYLEIVKASYLAAFPKRTFENWRRRELNGQVTIVNGTRHDCLIGAMRERSVVGVFLLPLQGFSIPADREMIKLFPKEWLLAGAIDTAVAMAAYPATLARDYNVPALDCAAVQWQDPENSLCFDPDDSKLDFDSRDLGAYGHCSGGVLVLRQS